MVMRKGQNNVLRALGESFFLFSFCVLILINVFSFTQLASRKCMDFKNYIHIESSNDAMFN